MSRRVAIQMDPIETINISADSTFMLALEAQKRGYQLYYYRPQHLWLRDGALFARAQTLQVRREQGRHFELGAAEPLDLAEIDVILMRQDPPFDMSYISATHMLEHIKDRTLIVNDPVSVRNAPEKLFVTHFPGVMPPTLITRERQAIEEFRAEFGDIIVKPLFGNGGFGVFRIRPDDENLSSLLEMFGNIYREPVMVQRYVPEVRQGDKRIILVDGEPVGAVLRVPADGEARANLHVGGRAVKAPLTDRDRELCRIIGPSLKEQGLLFVGIDVIGNYLTEINVTSPTGIQEINRLDDVAIEALIWDAIDAKLQR